MTRKKGFQPPLTQYRQNIFSFPLSSLYSSTLIFEQTPKIKNEKNLEKNLVERPFSSRINTCSEKVDLQVSQVAGRQKMGEKSLSEVFSLPSESFFIIL